MVLFLSAERPPTNRSMIELNSGTWSHWALFDPVVVDILCVHSVGCVVCVSPLLSLARSLTLSVSLFIFLSFSSVYMRLCVSARSYRRSGVVTSLPMPFWPFTAQLHITSTQYYGPIFPSAGWVLLRVRYCFLALLSCFVPFSVRCALSIVLSVSRSFSLSFVAL